jgi:hypothetical protein
MSSCASQSLFERALARHTPELGSAQYIRFSHPPEAHSGTAVGLFTKEVGFRLSRT